MIKTFILFICINAACTAASAQLATVDPSDTNRRSIALSPARFELEMKPGTETTVIVNLDYRSSDSSIQPTRILASLSDWTITKDGLVEYFPANSRRNSASPWIVYSPGETSVLPGNIHQIRVTISVPADAKPGDHLAALTVEQRPDTIKHEQTGSRTMIVRYRMATVFYIKVPGLTKRGSIEDLYAESSPNEILISPTLKNEGNSMVRPLASVKVIDSEGNVVADVADMDPLPVLAGGELKRPIRIEKSLAPGIYTVKYRVDFQDGEKVAEGVTDLIVKSASQVAAAPRPQARP
jgi:methionine-rich copper-binding protein CopC